MRLLKAGQQRKEVMLLNPVDHRYTPLHVDRETEAVIYCKEHDGVKYRFFKMGPGWTGKDVRFLAVEGNPLVTYVGPEEEKVEKGVGEYLRFVWGERAYSGLPAILKQTLEEKSIGVTVNVEPMIPDQSLQAAFDEVKAEGILYESDLENLSRLGESKEVKKWHDKIVDKLPWILAGIGLTYILQGMGVIKGF